MPGIYGCLRKRIPWQVRCCFLSSIPLAMGFLALESLRCDALSAREVALTAFPFFAFLTGLRTAAYR
jgi:hypothetical protein